MNLRRLPVCLMVCLVVVATPVTEARAAEWFVSAGSSGGGSSIAPFGRIQDALNVAQAGDVITVNPGTYRESLRTVRGGTASLPIRVRGQGERGTTIVTFAGKTLEVTHPYITIENLVFDGQYGLSDAITVYSGGSFFTLRNSEVRRSTRDLVDIRAPQGVLIDGCLIHHALNAANGRTDAHGIVAGAARDLTIRNTEIHTFSGDGFQIDPGRSSPGWDRVTIENSRIWLAPLPVPENGFAAGIVPGENAVDTKVGATLPRANITIRDTTAWGFRGGLIGNMAAFNLKESINATVDRVTVYDSEIAFRLRGAGSGTTGAWVKVKNAVVYATATAYRYEDDIQNLKIWNTTIGGNVTRAFQAASSGSGGLEVRNLLLLGTSLPSVAAHPSNRVVGLDAFVNAAAHNYMLAMGASVIDAGTTLPEVTTDRAGTARPQGVEFDIGAYEYVPAVTSGDIVIHAGTTAVTFGNWQIIPDSTAASGLRVSHPDAGLRVKNVQPSPVHYFEVIAWVEAGKQYRLWVRGKADLNSEYSDSVSVQFRDSIDTTGAAIYRIGTTSAVKMSLKECSACSISDWGWQDTSSALNALGPVVRFTTSGPQRVRFQTWEDGFSIDQIVLSPVTYIQAAPGLLRNDTTILPES